jgi:HlyD family secretion protein
MNTKLILAIFAVTTLFSCNNDSKKSDAYGNFEATETMVSSETSGKILSINAEEGSILDAGIVVAHIDSTQALLKIQQLEAQQASLSSRTATATAQINTAKVQLDGLNVDKQRIEKLYADGAATRQQYDDIHNRLNLLKSQYDAAVAQQKAVASENGVIESQLKQARDMYSKCNIINPLKGTILERYSDKGETVNPGTPLYKIADMSSLDLRVYISGSQLTSFAVGQKVKVLVDNGNEILKEMEGTVTWISSQSEFTPKVIQTREERVNLVYAMKVRVANDGSLKIGMPGEVKIIK